MIGRATGKEAFSVGKPSPIMMRAARLQLGLTSEQTVMVGETMETDILGGVGLGYRTLLVLSGGTALGDFKHFAYAPDPILDSVADIPVVLSLPIRHPAPAASSAPIAELLPV